MLETLIIRNFVLIDELHIDFTRGLTVITGETGAGKSILLGAIALLMGQRADSSTVRPGAERCLIEAHFSGVDDTIRHILAEEEIDADDDDLIIRREISVKGKSRSFVNDTPASLALLKRLSEYLIDIHSQHKNLLLGDAHFQRNVLDLYGANAELLSRYRTSFSQYKACSRELEELRQRQQEALREQDFLQFQYDQLEQANLRLGELQELEAEEQQLVHALDIKTGLSRSFTALDDDERGVMQALSVAIDGLTSIRRYWSEADELLERFHSVKVELGDLTQTLDTSAEAIEYNPERLALVTERLDLINTLLQRHHLTSIDELIALRDDLGERLYALTSSDEQITALTERVTAHLTEATELAEALHTQRTASAREVEQALVAGLQELGMPHVRLMIEVVREDTLSSDGCDRVTFRFSANKEIAPEPVADIASGGEISRLMLCIKALIADRRHLPTIIFDEIDTGVSGDIADRIGAILQRMGQSMQVMAVTHLPQIAASGIQHFYIYKEHGDETTRSHIRLLNEDERTAEIARMQSGSRITDVSLAAARELLTQSQHRNE